MNKKILLFDIDYTLFDTTKFKQLILQALLPVVTAIDFEKLDEVYYEVRKYGAFDPALFARFFEEKYTTPISENEIAELWYSPEILTQALYPETVSVLEKFQKEDNLTLGIFSSGNPDFQKAKITSIEHFFSEKYIYIAPSKNDILPEVLQTYKNEDIVFIDDFIPVLQKIKRLDAEALVIWIKRGKFAEKTEMPQGFYPDHVVENLTEVESLGLTTEK